MNKVTLAVSVIAMLTTAVLLVGCSPEKPAGMQETPAARSRPEAQTISQTACPVMGGKINKDIYVDHQGKRIYFCCPGCPEKFKENPEKYLEKLEATTPAPQEATANELCPVMGMKVNKDLYVDHQGKRIYFCCPGCPEKFKENPEKYLEKLEATTPAPQEATANELCPVMGMKVNKDLYVEYQGRRVHFCCPACKPKFEGAPERYTHKL